MYLAQKEAWEQQAEKMHSEQPSTVVTQMGKPKYTPCPANLEQGQIQFWMSNISGHRIQSEILKVCLPVIQSVYLCMLQICSGINLP